MKIDTDNYASPDGVALRLHGDLDAHTFEALDEAIQAHVSAGMKVIVVDLSDVPYMSSAGIGVMIGAKTEMEDEGGQLVLLNPQATVSDALESLGLDALFTIFKSESEAVRELGLNPYGEDAGQTAVPPGIRGPVTPGRETSPPGR